MNVLGFLRSFARPVWVVAKREAWANTRSLRLVIVAAILALSVLGAAFGLSGLSGGGPSLAEQNLLWVHPAHPSENLSDRTAVLFISDAFGHPRPGVPVVIGRADPISGVLLEVNRTVTASSGRASFGNLTQSFYTVWIEVGSLIITEGVVFSDAPFNLSVQWKQFDLARAGIPGDVFFQATDGRGSSVAGARLEVNGTEVGRTDANGFVHHRLTTSGRHFLNVTSGADREEFVVFVPRPGFQSPVFQGPNALLAFLALFIMSLMLPILAIAMSYDAIAKERFTGSMDLLLIRPVSRAGVAVGKFLGVWIAVAIPTITVALAGVVAVTSISGASADAGFVATFLGGSLFLIAAYILLMQIFSTLAKTPGTAILAGFVVWIVFEILWGVVFLLVTAVFGIQGGTEGYFVAQTLTSLTNPGGVYAVIIGSALPPDATIFGQGVGFGVPPSAGWASAGAWILFLLPLAVWTFVRKAAH